jgi:hypothetical protein
MSECILEEGTYLHRNNMILAEVFGIQIISNNSIRRVVKT